LVNAVLQRPSLKSTAASLLWFSVRSRIAPWRDRDAAALRAVLERIENQSSNLAMDLKDI